MDQNNAPEGGIRHDEPTQYELNYSSQSLPQQQPRNNNKKTIIFVCIVIAVLAGSIFFIARSVMTPQKMPVQVSPSSVSSSIFSTPVSVPTASITIVIQKTKNGTRITVQWENLPDGTVKIEIFRAATQNGPGVLIETIAIGPSSLAGGNASFDLTGKNQTGYFYGIAAGDDGSPLYNSAPTTPVDTSTTPAPQPTSQPTPSSTPGNGTPETTPPSDNQTSTGTTENGSDTITYYNPQGGISGTASGTVTENFLVQHVDQKIQIGWQNLPADTDLIVVSRSASNTGPWVAVLTQNNPVVNMPYSIQIVDDTLGNAYYYKMDGYEENGTTNTYGPVLLGPL